MIRPTRKGTFEITRNNFPSRNGQPFSVGVVLGVVVTSAVLVGVYSFWMRSSDTCSSSIADSLTSVYDIPELEAQSSGRSTDFRFLPNRRNMWVGNRRLGTVVHYRLTDTMKGAVERSHVAHVDQARFPVRDTVYKISERNVTDLLWVCNRRTGDFELWRRNVRDGRLVPDDLPIEAGAHLRNDLSSDGR